MKLGQLRAADKVFKTYLNEAELNKSSYLYNHYKRGLAGVMRPSDRCHLAEAAWRAGNQRKHAK